MTSLSGFPDLSDQETRQQKKMMDALSSVFESYGYVPLETPAVERLETLQCKGEIDKEIYVLSKPHMSGQQEKLGLRYDLTVPFARYVATHGGVLKFPFKRYQMQKVWRGERPQKGRLREFYQCDVDVVVQDHVLPFHDLEVLMAGYDGLRALPIPPFTLRLSHRKIFQGYLEALGYIDMAPILRILDKMDKIGEASVRKLLEPHLKTATKDADRIMDLCRISTPDLSFVKDLEALGVMTPLMAQGIEELSYLMGHLLESGRHNICVDFGFVRGLDYYTGVIFEGFLRDEPGLGSICSGGRYDDLLSRFTAKKMPGVGFSIGLSRLMAFLKTQKAHESPLAPADIMMVHPSSKDFQKSLAMAQALRQRGLRVWMFEKELPFSKQLKWAQKRGFAWVCFLSLEDAETYDIKNMKTGAQSSLDLEKALEVYGSPCSPQPLKFHDTPTMTPEGP